MKFNEQILETNSNIIKSYTDSSITVLDKEYNYNVIVPPEKSIIKCSAKAKSITDSFIIDSLSDNADLIIIHTEWNEFKLSELMNLSSACSCHNILLAEKRNFLSFFIFN